MYACMYLINECVYVRVCVGNVCVCVCTRARDPVVVSVSCVLGFRMDRVLPPDSEGSYE